MSLDTAENWQTIVEPGDLQGKIILQSLRCRGRVGQQEAPSEPCLADFEKVVGVIGNFERDGYNEVTKSTRDRLYDCGATGGTLVTVFEQVLRMFMQTLSSRFDGYNEVTKVYRRWAICL
jgi:hypothetical protein